MKNGFTLIELLVVIAIIGIIATVVAVNLGARGDLAKRELTRTAIARLKGEVDLFNLHEHHFPAQLEELVARGQLEEVPLDGWERPFHYETPGTRGAPFDLVSYGADGAPGGTGVNEDLWSHRPK